MAFLKWNDTKKWLSFLVAKLWLLLFILALRTHIVLFIVFERFTLMQCVRIWSFFGSCCCCCFCGSAKIIAKDCLYFSSLLFSVVLLIRGRKTKTMNIEMAWTIVRAIPSKVNALDLVFGTIDPTDGWMGWMEMLMVIGIWIGLDWMQVVEMVGGWKVNNVVLAKTSVDPLEFPQLWNIISIESIKKKFRFDEQYSVQKMIPQSNTENGTHVRTSKCILKYKSAHSISCLFFLVCVYVWFFSWTGFFFSFYSFILFLQAFFPSCF